MKKGKEKSSRIYKSEKGGQSYESAPMMNSLTERDQRERDQETTGENE